MSRLELFAIVAAAAASGTAVTLAVVGWYIWKATGV